jgi:hypothetical protein
MQSFAMTGIFREEIPFQFLQLVSKVAWDYISYIFKRVIQKYQSQEDKNFKLVFVKCLTSVKGWCPKTKYQELSKLKKVHPYISEVYEYTYLAALNEFCKTLNQTRKEKKFTIPVFDDFFVLFLTKVSDADYVQDLKILKYTFEQLMFLFATVLRESFMECIQYISMPQQNTWKHAPYDQDVESVMSLTEENLKWHNQTYPSSEHSRDMAESVILDDDLEDAGALQLSQKPRSVSEMSLKSENPYNTINAKTSPHLAIKNNNQPVDAECKNNQPVDRESSLSVKSQREVPKKTPII